MGVIMKYIGENSIIQAIIAVIIGIILYRMVIYLFERWTKRIASRRKLDKKVKTYVKVIKNLIKYIFIIVVGVIVLQLNGVNVSGIVAGLGVAGVVAGFALQDTLKDLIMGLSIMIEDFFNVGDIVKYGEVEGKIISFGLKTTKIQDIYTNDIVTISNRKIDEIKKSSEWLDLDIPISYEDSVEKIEEIIVGILPKIEMIEDVSEAHYKGINAFEASNLVYKIRVYCKPETKPQTKRDALRIVKLILDKNGIVVPYTQIDIHNK